MKTLVIAAALLITGAVAKPGGYTGYGGVYKAMNVEKETMSAAKKAAQDAIFDDASLKSEAETRKERNTALYIPTFFTGVPQETLHPVAAAHADRFQRDANTYQQQTFYREYSPSARAIY